MVSVLAQKMNCSSCDKPIPENEFQCYRGRCEECWLAGNTSSHCNNNVPSGFGKRQKGDSGWMGVEYAPVARYRR
jgi:hypothetical protein